MGFDVFETHNVITNKLEPTEDIEPIGCFFDIIQNEFKDMVSPEETSSSSDNLIMEIPSPTHKYEYMACENSSDYSDTFDYPLDYDLVLQDGRTTSRYTVTDTMEPMEVDSESKPEKNTRISLQDPLADQDSEDLVE